MKKLILIIIIISVIALIISCTQMPSPIITEVSAFWDITDKQLSDPNANDILSLFDFSGDNKWNGADFHFAGLSDVSYIPFSEVKINTAGMWLSNDLARDAEIKNFKNGVLKIIQTAGNDTIGKRNSSLYLPIARELNRLSQSKVDKKYLLIYSDLMENTIDISFYNKKTIEQLQTNSDAIKKQFEQMQALQNLNGIEVYLIYQPVDSESDKTFTIVSGFYKKLLEEKGAKVNITANINL